MVEPEVEAFNRGPPKTRDRDQRLLDITQGEAGMRMAVVVVKSSVKAYRLSCVRDCKQVQTLFKQTSFWSQAPISMSISALGFGLRKFCRVTGSPAEPGCGGRPCAPAYLLPLTTPKPNVQTSTYPPPTENRVYRFSQS